MNQAFAARIREASIVLPDSTAAALETAVEKLAEPSGATLGDQLARLRLAFGLPISTEDRLRLDDQFTQTGVPLESRDEQMRRVLASCVLVSRFGRGQGKRKVGNLSGDTLAALGARALDWSGRTSAHPDVASWAAYCLENLSVDVRSKQELPDRPTLVLDPQSTASVAADGTPVPAESSEDLIARWKDQVSSYTNALATWSTELDRGQIATNTEQFSLLWWIQSAAPAGSPSEVCAVVGNSLAELTSRIPGPPRIHQLLLRRLGSRADEPVELGALSELLNTSVPAEAADLCPLLTGVAKSAIPRTSMVVASEWLVTELLFVRLYGEMSKTS